MGRRFLLRSTTGGPASPSDAPAFGTPRAEVADQRMQVGRTGARRHMPELPSSPCGWAVHVDFARWWYPSEAEMSRFLAVPTLKNRAERTTGLGWAQTHRSGSKAHTSPDLPGVEARPNGPVASILRIRPWALATPATARNSVRTRADKAMTGCLKPWTIGATAQRATVPARGNCCTNATISGDSS